MTARHLLQLVSIIFALIEEMLCINKERKRRKQGKRERSQETGRMPRTANDWKG